MIEIVNEKTKAYLEAIGCKAKTYLDAYTEICKLVIELDIKSYYHEGNARFYVSIYKVHTEECYDTILHDNVEEALDEAIEIIYKHKLLNHE